MAEVAKAIDAVHGDGPLRQLWLSWGARQDAEKGIRGQYSHTHLGAVGGISVMEGWKDKRLTLAHEIGHWLDHVGLKNYKKKPAEVTLSPLFTTDVPADTPGMQQLMQAFRQTRAISNLRARSSEQRHNGYMLVTKADGSEAKLKISQSYLDYALQAKEIFARGYAQYIAVRSGDAEMMAELRREQASDKQEYALTNIQLQWDDDDFEPVAKAMDAVLEAIGWRH